DVMSSAEARAIAAGNPLSFLHVSKPEIDLSPATNAYDAAVYAKGKENFIRLINDGALRQDAQACFYLYRQVIGNRTAPGGFLSAAGGRDQGEGPCFTGQNSQLGLVAVASCEDYLRDVIKKHELTRPDKEEDRLRHTETLNAQTGPVFLTYRAVPALNDFFQRVASG